ncbi:MAG: hypothetical protein IEMM0008_0346 [bacterium]|nr:MAG: hypothetical protein IEMM0008_0346 [bacterium]
MKPKKIFIQMIVSLLAILNVQTDMIAQKKDIKFEHITINNGIMLMY